MMQRHEDRPLGELFTELVAETRTLLRQEMALVRTELAEKIVQIGKDAAAAGAGLFVLYVGALTLVAAIVLGIANFIPLWLSALLVGIFFLVVGVGLVLKARKDLTHMKMVPEKSAETVKETAQWAKTQVK